MCDADQYLQHQLNHMGLRTFSGIGNLYQVRLIIYDMVGFVGNWFFPLPITDYRPSQI
jgi:hypothetical protein